MANKRGSSRRGERNRRTAAQAAKQAKAFVAGKSAGKRGKSVNAPKGIW
jgi:hypothetical protein